MDLYITVNTVEFQTLKELILIFNLLRKVNTSNDIERLNIKWINGHYHTLTRKKFLNDKCLKWYCIRINYTHCTFMPVSKLTVSSEFYIRVTQFDLDNLPIIIIFLEVFWGFNFHEGWNSKCPEWTDFYRYFVRTKCHFTFPFNHQYKWIKRLSAFDQW